MTEIDTDQKLTPAQRNKNYLARLREAAAQWKEFRAIAYSWEQIENWRRKMQQEYGCTVKMTDDAIKYSATLHLPELFSDWRWQMGKYLLSDDPQPHTFIIDLCERNGYKRLHVFERAELEHNRLRFHGDEPGPVEAERFEIEVASEKWAITHHPHPPYSNSPSFLLYVKNKDGEECHPSEEQLKAVAAVSIRANIFEDVQALNRLTEKDDWRPIYKKVCAACGFTPRL